MPLRSSLLTELSLRPETLARLAPLVNLVLIIALAYLLADLTLRLMSGPAVPATAPVPAASGGTRSTSRQGDDYTRITGWQLFGPPVSEAPPPAVVVNAPETRLNLRLAGIFFSDGDNSRPLALIAADGRPEQVFRIGDTLNDGTRIARILADRVLLERNNQLEALSLPRDTVTESEPAATPTTGTSRSTTAQSGVIDATAITRELRQQIAADPQALQNLAYAAPYIENDRFAGLRLQPGRDPQLLGQLGLRSGDVLLELNGTRLTDPTQGAILLQELLRAERMDARVLRNGSEVPLTFILSR